MTDAPVASEAERRPPVCSAITDAPSASEPERLRLRDGTAVALRPNALERHAARAGDERAAIEAEVDGRVVGRASYERVYGPRAVLQMEVDGAYWHRGLPAALLTALGACAAPLGIATFVICVRARDVRLLALLRQDFGARGIRDGAWVELEFPALARSR